jgi:hypothetical protein
MAIEAGIYECIWRPDLYGFRVASTLIDPFTKAIAEMESDPERFRAFDASNGWGTYNDFLPWLKRYFEACIKNPDAIVEVSR